MLIDTHAHLDMEQFDTDLDDVISRAQEAGVGHIISVSIDTDSLRRTLELATTRQNISATAGIHPHEAGKLGEEDWEAVAVGADDPVVVAIGETGLDYYRDWSPRQKQIELFHRHIDLARRVGKPLVIHSREADKETLAILDKEGARDIGGVMHCFSGTLETAHRAIDMGFLISIAGPLTYPRSHLVEVVRKIPADHLVVETDAPYLAPQAYRGRRNEPAYVVETARALSALKELSLDDIHRITTFNALSLFRLPGSENAGQIAYVIRDSLYLNVTNRCTNRCVFCGRENRPVVKGHNLRLIKEPSAQEILSAAGDVSGYREVVFCGYGEPLLRWDTVRHVAQKLKRRGARIRINTNGQSRLFLGRNILPDMAGTVDALSVSLNAADNAQYRRLCRPESGEAAFEAMKQFIREAKEYVPEVTATVVSAPGVDVEACRRIATDELGVNFRARTYNEVG